MITIFVDMDGVLAEFDVTFLKLYGEFGKESFKKFVTDGYFLSLPMMPRAKELVERLNSFDVNIEVLSSLGNVENLEWAAEQKRTWLINNGINWHPNFTQHKGLKRNFANNCSILLDDTNINVVEFSVNGFSILYKEENFDTMMTMLEALVNKLKSERNSGIYKVERFA